MLWLRDKVAPGARSAKNIESAAAHPADPQYGLFCA